MWESSTGHVQLAPSTGSKSWDEYIADMFLGGWGARAAARCYTDAVVYGWIGRMAAWCTRNVYLDDE